MPDTTEENREKYEYWLRVVASIDHAGKKLCSDILHVNGRLPKDGKELYDQLEKYQKNFQYKIHEEILSPSDKFINEKKFDLLIYAIVIDSIFGDEYDSLLDDVGDLRNKIFHMEDKKICTTESEEMWGEASDVLCKHGFVTKPDNALKFPNLHSYEEYKGNSDFIYFINMFLIFPPKKIEAKKLWRIHCNKTAYVKPIVLRNFLKGSSSIPVENQKYKFSENLEYI